MMNEKMDSQQQGLPFGSIVESLDDAVIGLSLEGIIISWNSGAERIYGYSAAEVMGKPNAILLPHNRANELEKLLIKIRHGAGLSRYETVRVRKDGESVNILYTIFPIKNAANKITAALSVAHDITEQKQNKKELKETKEITQAFLNAITESAFVIDSTGIILAINEKAAQSFNSNVQELLGQSVYHFLTPEFTKLKKGQIEKVIQTKKSVNIEEEKDGRCFNYSVYPFLDKDSQISKIVIFPTDITEKKELENERLKSQKFESITHLAQGVAHNFNNVLTAISNNIAHAKSYIEQDSKAYHLLDNVERLFFQTKAISQQLFSLSKRGFILNKQLCSISELVENTVNLSIVGSDIQAAFSVQDKLWPVEVDASLIGQVINNLIVNAKDAMPKGGVIEVKIENTIEKDEEYIKISVKDYGIGISKSNLHKIFDPYFTTKQTGNGLGLSTSYSIIRAHNGYFYAKSLAHTGTVFEIYLPALERKNVKMASKKTQILISRGKILMLADKNSISRRTEKWLSDFGYQIKLTDNQADLHIRYQKTFDSQQRYDIVVLDLDSLNQLDGEQLVKDIFDMDPQCKIIVMSSQEEHPVMMTEKQHNLIHKLIKPYFINELEDIINHALKSNLTK